MLPWIALPAALAGWFVGWLFAWLTEWLQPAEDATSIRWRSMLARDPLVQGGLAIIWAVIPFVVAGDIVRWTEAAILSVPLVQVGVTDFRTRYVYTVIAGIGLALGLLLGWHYHGVNGGMWPWTIAGPWTASVVGALTGAVLFGLLYLIGRLVYRGGEPMARGDVTIAAMVGAGASTCVLTALVYGILASGLIAVGVLVIARSRHVYMPYGPGLCLGGLATLFLC